MIRRRTEVGDTGTRPKTGVENAQSSAGLPTGRGAFAGRATVPPDSELRARAGEALDATDAGEGFASDTVHRTLTRAVSGDRQAASDLLPLLYDELRRLAAARLRRLPSGQTLQPTALVHEAFLRVADREPDGWDGRRHFFFAAARAMRDIIVEDARRKSAKKRGGDRHRVEFAEMGLALEIPMPVEDLVALDEVLDRLQEEHPEHHEIVLLRYFVGLDADETATLLGVSASTLKRKWRFARAYLFRSLAGRAEDADSADA